MENNESLSSKMQFPSEFLSDGDMYKLFNNYGLIIGRMISGSKSGYRKMYPDHDIVFNANVIIKSRGKVWHGDLDLNFDREKLQNVANELLEPLYILYEMDARFGNENDSIETLISKAKFKIENKIKTKKS